MSAFLFTKKFYMTMEVIFETKVIVRILYILMLFTMFHVEADKFECIKSDECSCRINGTQQEISLWPMPSGNRILMDNDMNWLFDIDLCHGINKNTDAPSGGCQNATVCQYSGSKKNETFEVGQFGNVTFGQYDNETKSITLLYYGLLQENNTRSIKINLTCEENGNVSKASYDMVRESVLDNSKFKTTIETKAACLRSVVAPTSPGSVTSSGKLETVYIVLIVVVGFVVVGLAIGFYVGRKIAIKRKRRLLTEEDDNDDYGTVPRVHVQNALSTPVSGPV